MSGDFKDTREPVVFDSDEKDLLIKTLGREGTSHMGFGMHKEQLEFVARCFDLAAKIARSAEPAFDLEAGGKDQ